MAPTTMKALIYNGPRSVSLEQRPVPTIKDETDIIVKVTYTALCGSELHVYRGHQKSPTGFIMGHEFTGIVTEVGKDVKSVSVGDKVVSPFTVSWSVLPLLVTYLCAWQYMDNMEESIANPHAVWSVFIAKMGIRLGVLRVNCLGRLD